MTCHTLDATESTLHGCYSREFEPVLTIEPGDSVRFRTLDGDWGAEPYPPSGERRRLAPRHTGLSHHALTGPVLIRGAEPGMTLAIRIGAIKPGTWGWNFGGRRDGQRKAVLHRWTLDPATMRGWNQYGHTVALRPFMGVMGLPPAEPGQHISLRPRPCGGNLDCKELISGSTLYLPIAVPGALFSVGDGHAAQGDGEISSTAIECPMDEVELTFDLRPEMHLTLPRAHTPAGWLTLGLDEDLNKATSMAIEGMLDLMVEQLGVDRADALALASVVVDLRITQIVNGVRGVHAVLPHGAIQKL